MIEDRGKNPGSPAAARKLSRPRPDRAKKRSSRARSPARKVKTSIAMNSAAIFAGYGSLAGERLISKFFIITISLLSMSIQYTDFPFTKFYPLLTSAAELFRAWIVRRPEPGISDAKMHSNRGRQ
jgi:hypothetical protein